MSSKSWPSGAFFNSRDQAEYLGILGLAPADAVKAFVADIAPELGPVDVISVHTGLLRFDEATYGDSAAFPAQDVLVTDAHVLLSGWTDGYSAVFGSDADHAIAAAVLDAALHADAATEAHRALQGRIAQFIDAQAALLARADDPADEVPGEHEFPQADLLPA